MNNNKLTVPENKVRYSIICDKFPIPQTYFDTCRAASMFVKMEQPNDKPHYIIKCTESYEIIEIVR